MFELYFLVMNITLASVVGIAGIVENNGMIVIMSAMFMYGTFIHFLINKDSDNEE